MSDDLVEQLRNKTIPTGFKDAVDEGTGDYFLEIVNTPDAVCIKAADRIEQLVATCEELQAHVAELERSRWALVGDKINLRSELIYVEARAEAAEALLPEAVKAGMLYGAKVNPLVWGYHPCGAIAAPPTGHAYIIDTRMKGRVYSVKGFKPEREFGSLDEAKAAAQTDYEARIMAALEPAPAGVTVQEPDPAPMTPVIQRGMHE